MRKIISRAIPILSTLCVIGLFQTSYLRSVDGTTITDAAVVSHSLKSKRESLSVTRYIPAFSFRNMKADIVFLDFLQYLGDDAERSETGYELSPVFFQSIIEDDPYYTDFYVFLSGSTSLIAAMPDESVKLMSLGLEKLSPQHPKDGYYVWRYKGVDELLFIGDSQLAQKSFQTAAEWAKVSSEQNSSIIAEVSQQTANFLKENPESTSAQISAWTSVLTTAIDDGTRKRAIEKIESLGGEIAVDENGNMRVKHAQKPQGADS